MTVDQFYTSAQTLVMSGARQVWVPNGAPDGAFFRVAAAFAGIRTGMGRCIGHCYLEN